MRQNGATRASLASELHSLFVRMCGSHPARFEGKFFSELCPKDSHYSHGILLHDLGRLFCAELAGSDAADDERGNSYRIMIRSWGPCELIMRLGDS